MEKLENLEPETVINGFITTHFGNDDACPSQTRHQLRKWKKIYYLLKHMSGNAETGMQIIGNHTSKSITLPVVRYSLANGIIITVRDNFYDNAITVLAPQRVKQILPLGLLFDKNDPDSSHHYFEGFEDADAEVYGTYNADPKQFSCHIADNDLLTVFLSILAAQRSAGK